MDGAALVQSAQVALAEGDIVGTVARLREAVALGPNPSARELLAGLLFLEDDLVGARVEMELAFREWRAQGEVRAAALVAASLADLHSSGFGTASSAKDGCLVPAGSSRPRAAASNRAMSSWRSSHVRSMT